jgi:hypothetical protein
MPAPFPSPHEFRDTIRQQMPDLPDLNEPGFASTFNPSALKDTLWNYGPTAALGGMGAALWYLNQQRPSVKAKAIAKKKQRALAAEKTADLKETIENIRWHLPKLRVPDTVAGGLAGAGVGGLYDLIRGKGKDGKRKTLKRLLTGALTGAGLSNVVGDRFRRYISNTKLPLGYTPTAAAEIKPSLRRIWNAAILDKPDYDPTAVAYWNNRPGVKNMLPFLPARQEIVRRQFGLPVDQTNPWWQKNPEGYYSLNEKSPDYAHRLPLLFGSYGRTGIRRDPWLSRSGPDQILKNPARALPAFSKYPDSQTDTFNFFGASPLFGGMHLPHVKHPDGSYSGMALDRWDVTPNQLEADYFKKNWRRALTDAKWRNAPLKENLSWYLKNDGAGHTNASTMKALGGRLVWDNLLSDELPWIGQKFKIAPHTTPRTWGQYVGGGYAPNTLQFLKADNTPATDAMDYTALDTWDKNK